MSACRTIVKAAVVATAALALVPSGSSAAPSGDASLETIDFTVPTDDISAGSAVVMCPSGTRPTGGGVAPVDPFTSGDNYRVQESGPVDETGVISTTVDGDVPQGWLGTVFHFGLSPTDPEPFRVFAVCSASTDAVLEAETYLGGDFLTQSAVICPVGSQALGGGWGGVSPVPAGSLIWQGYASGPVDDSGNFTDTSSGDIPAAWRTALVNQQGGPTADVRLFAVCSAEAEATIESSSFAVAADPATGSAQPECSNGNRAVSGGVGPADAADLAHSRVRFSAPIGVDSSLGNTETGAVAGSWLSSARNRNMGAGVSFKALAVCLPSTPPETEKDSGPDGTTSKDSAKFKFHSDLENATFECKLDSKNPKKCKSPAKVRNLDPGKHKFTVTAIEPTGADDPTPVKYSWKVKD